MHANTLPRTWLRTTALDALLLALVWLVPALSHQLAYPLYLLEPMRLATFAALFLSTRRNAYAMALALPLFSYLTSGHPVAPKFFLIQIELLVNLAVFFRLRDRRWNLAAAAALSVVASKILYYAGKLLLIRTAQLEGSLVSTPWSHQLTVLALVVSGGLLADALRSRR